MNADDTAVIADMGDVVSAWISADDRLPNIDEWVNVLVDRNEGDYFARQNRPRYSVTPATLRDTDSEGNASWQQGMTADGAPLTTVNYVTHWMPLPAPPK